MTFDTACKAVAFGDADDVNAVAGSKPATVTVWPTSTPSIPVRNSRTKRAASTPCFLKCPARARVTRGLLNRAEAERNGVIAMRLFRAAFHDRAGTGFDHRDRNVTSVIGEHARHPNLAAKDIFHLNPRPVELVKHTGPRVLLFAFTGTREESADRLDHNLGTISRWRPTVKRVWPSFRTDEPLCSKPSVASCGRPYSLSSLLSLPDALGPGAMAGTTSRSSRLRIFRVWIRSLSAASAVKSWRLFVYSYLVKFDDRGELVPEAAIEVPTRNNGGISPDGLRIVYHLRPGIRFSDGSTLTSFDVAETIGHVTFPGSDAPSRVAFDDIAAISTPDDMTVKMYLRTPYAPIVLYLCGPGNAVPILSAQQLAGHAHLRGTILDSAPIGSGPYRVDPLAAR